jgi:hypothetical protein
VPTAILVDGGCFVKRYRAIVPSTQGYDASNAAKCLFRWSLQHLEDRDQGKENCTGSSSMTARRFQRDRREGIDFILDNMWQPVPNDLYLHIVGLRSTCPKPRSKADSATA